MSEQSIEVHVVVVSSTQGRGDTAGPEVVARLTAAGHTIGDRLVVTHDERSIREALLALVESGVQAVVLVGGSTVFEARVAIEAATRSFTRRLDAYGPLALQIAYSKVGSQAVWLEGVAGLVGRVPVFVLPSSPEVAGALIDQLVAPQLSAMVGWGLQANDPAPRAEPSVAGEVDWGPDPHTQDAVFEELPEAAPAAAAMPDEPALPTPTGRLGRLGKGGLSFTLAAAPDAEPPREEEAGLPGAGWLRALHEIEGAIDRERREELPQPVERLAPLIDVLHQAGEVAVLKLPSGVRYSLWGYPDLRRPGSKVLAVGWGQPLAEVLALHRYPVQTGTCIDEAHGLLPRASDDVVEACEAITGQRPADPADARLFAVEGDAVWLLRGARVTRFDGRKEVDQGSPKQALVTLTLGWSQR